MILLLLATAAAEPLTISTETGDLQADEVHILELDEDGNIKRGPSLQDVIDSNFAADEAGWHAGVGALHSFHRELGESQTHITADVGHILGTEDGARSCTCPRGCSSGECEFNVEVDYLFSASLQCAGTCESDPCTTEATDAGGDESQTSAPGEGPVESDDETFGGVEQPAATCDGECEEDVMSADDPNFNHEVIRILNLWSGAGRGPGATEPCD